MPISCIDNIVYARRLPKHKIAPDPSAAVLSVSYQWEIEERKPLAVQKLAFVGN
jgi:hypothetical protein